MEAVIAIVGFLGAGKTTLLKYLVENFIAKDWQPYVILNDYENAKMDTQHFKEYLNIKSITPLSGSCICCNGIVELRETINRIPERKNGITLIEANGTSDACTLMEFLGVGLSKRFLPPIQISVVDVKNWQKRDENNELEINQIQVSSILVLTHTETTTKERQENVCKQLKEINPTAKIISLKELDVFLLPNLIPSKNIAQKINHLKTHWASSSIDLPTLVSEEIIYKICKLIPKSILRVKGCVQIENEEDYIYFEKKPDGEIKVRPFNGIPITGAKLLTIGPGSNPKLLKDIVNSQIL